MNSKNEWDGLKSNFPGNALYRGKILKFISIAYEKYLEHGGDEASLKYYDVVVEIDEAGKFVEILFALKIVDQAIKPTIDLMDIIGFTFDFGDGRLIDVATERR
ncbi:MULTISPECIES: hypothetical protein [unclassified Duganella]|uniref:hypothetical protein n=1 Tax=unclassified Duganella TaxID=2636909 RepID=UPI00070BEE0F|nr:MULTISPECIES: hypothetical protein [unclassified Duganella]